MLFSSLTSADAGNWLQAVQKANQGGPTQPYGTVT